MHRCAGKTDDAGDAGVVVVEDKVAVDVVSDEDGARPATGPGGTGDAAGNTSSADAGGMPCVAGLSWRCASGDACVKAKHKCDGGVPDCRDGSDESAAACGADEGEGADTGTPPADGSAEGTSGDDTDSTPMIVATVVGVLVLVAAVACAAHKCTGGSEAAKAAPGTANGAHPQEAAQRVANAVYDLGYTDEQGSTRSLALGPNSGAAGSALRKHADDLAGRKVPNAYDLEEPHAPHHYDLVEAKTRNAYDLEAPATSNHYDLEEAEAAGTRGRGKPTSANAYDLEEAAHAYDLGEPEVEPNAYDLEAPHTYDLGAAPDDTKAYDLGASVAPHTYDLGAAPASAGAYDLGAGPESQAYDSMSEEEI